MSTTTCRTPTSRLTTASAPTRRRSSEISTPRSRSSRCRSRRWLPDQIRVQVEACGLCHTDIHAAHGDWPVKPAPPFTPGHEGVGHVVERGRPR